MMRACFFKGRHPGLRGLFGVLIKHWMSGDYSHVELQFSDGLCGSSAYLDNGVRLKTIDFVPADWDFIELPDSLEVTARAWFMQHDGKAYDFLGDIHFVIGTIAASRDKWFCSRAVADALGIKDGFRFDPNCLAATLLFYSVHTLQVQTIDQQANLYSSDGGRLEDLNRIGMPTPQGTS